MSGSNHVAGGTVFTGIFLSMYDINIFSSPNYIFFTVFFALLPDVDHVKSFIGKLFYPIAKYLNRKFGHRTITHSLIFYLVGYVIVAFIEKALTKGTIISRIYLWAYGSHLIFDMLTKQGVPLFYPFKKNPCVIPANPAYRFRGSDFKTEATIFLVFFMIGFTCKNLFAHGFWNTYNRAFDNVKHVYEESRKYDGVIKVKFRTAQRSGEAVLISATTSKLLLFSDGFFTLTDNDKIATLTPIRSNIRLSEIDFSFSNISIDSLQKLIKDKPLKTIKLQAILPISYYKDHAPQSGTSVSLDYVFNPVFESTNVDSTDENIQKEISLLELQIATNNRTLSAYQDRKEQALNRLRQNEIQINSKDLAVKEEAVKSHAQFQKEVENLNPPLDNSKALNIRREFLLSKLHIKRQQKISGYISFIIIK
ncbi:MAG: metal-dependent hydrolase [Ginsengibacter sp.]